jgi:hypothetical protein
VLVSGVDPDLWYRALTWLLNLCIITLPGFRRNIELI